jgi:hypothetical protein
MVAMSLTCYYRDTVTAMPVTFFTLAGSRISKGLKRSILVIATLVIRNLRVILVMIMAYFD